ncbi:MAG: hypothetical protein LBU65_08050 [Planctomycetaceae bacterium]|jgi:hypothetical protein|nr:hypothetical protein [Planctomycetaceae bacterium]
MIFAYIDPFAASLLFQFIAMGLLSAAVFFQRIKLYVMGLFSHKKTAEKVNDTNEAEERDPSTLTLSMTDEVEKRKAA